ncbi:MAG: CPBP family intramembrane metalloprotease [wastewater metagenome]|nr:CPBP family intramembrane metalloprotease [Candidatus Loosdrechtia aerotolerans]
MKPYFHRSRGLANSFLFILPLLIFYEIGIVIQGSNIKNTADVIIKTPFMVFGKNSSLIFNLLIIIFVIVSLFFIEKKYKLSILVFAPMFIESVLYALLLGYVLGFIVYQILFPSPLVHLFSMNMVPLWTEIVLSVGAGVYEEIVFRFLLLTLFYFTCTVLFKINKPFSIITSILFTSLLFASIHYIGILGDHFTYTSFIFRFSAGVVLSIIFMLRGLGIAVYTHAIYNILLVLRSFQV